MACIRLLLPGLMAEANTRHPTCGAPSRKLLDSLFEREDLRANDLKGIAGPVHAWAVLRASSVESRFERCMQLA